MAERGEGYLFRPQYRDRHGVKRKSSAWWWRISVSGRKQLINTHQTDRRAARRWTLDRLAEMNGGDTSVLTAERLTLERLEQLVLHDYVVNGRRTKRHIPLSFGRLRRILGEGTRTAEITTARLSEYAARRLKEGAAPATINLDFSVLSKGMHLAAREGLIPRRPKGWLPLLRVDNARKGFLERPEFEAILARMPEVLRGVLVTAYVTGWRLHSELITRQWRHVDLAAGWLRLEPGEGKTGEGRMFPLTPELRTVLEAQRAYTDRVERERGAVVPWVFHREGRRIVSIQKSWETARRKAGLPTALVHDFRRTAVRNLERAGVPRSAAMALIGHRTEAVYRRYCIVDESMLAESAEKLAALHETQRKEVGKVRPLIVSLEGARREPRRP